MSIAYQHSSHDIEEEEEQALCPRLLWGIRRQIEPDFRIFQRPFVILMNLGL